MSDLKEWWNAAPASMLMVAGAIVTFAGCCLYWQFGLNPWVKIGLAPAWILFTAVACNAAALIDL